MPIIQLLSHAGEAVNELEFPPSLTRPPVTSKFCEFEEPKDSAPCVGISVWNNTSWHGVRWQIY